MLIGRDELVDQILNGTLEVLRVDDLPGSLGAGKTTILGHLRANAPGFTSVAVDLEDFDPGHPGDVGDDASVGAVQASFEQFSRLLGTLLEGKGPDIRQSFDAEVMREHNADVLGASLLSLEDSLDELREDLSPQDLAEAWRGAAQATSDSFLKYWNEDSDGDPRLLLADNVDCLKGQEIGLWFDKLICRLERTVVVRTRELGGVPLEEQPVDVRTHEITNFTVEDVAEYLRHDGRGPVPAGLAKLVHDATQGHPATVGIVRDLLRSLSETDRADSHRLLAGIPRERAEKLAALVEILLCRLGEPALAEALKAAAVPRRLDATLLVALLDGAMKEGEARALFDRLGEFTFFESLAPAGKPRRTIRMHSYLRNGILDRMGRSDPEQLQRLHTRIADHYAAQVMRGDERDGAPSYGDWFTYEDPGWQSREREWLYHLGQAATPKDRTSALLDFAKVFLDAFWWWGSYVHFNFCDQLVADLAQTARRSGNTHGDPAYRSVPGADEPWPELEVLAHSFRAILHDYPLHSVKPSTADWGNVRAALLTTKRVCGLTPGVTPRWTRKQIHVAALLYVFLAHTYRYQDGDVDDADECYARADQLFDRHEDTWSQAWVAYERADFWLQHGDADRAKALWARAAELAQPRVSAELIVLVGDDEPHVSDRPDDELVADLHRVRGDDCWERGDRLEAAACYGRAVLHAYLFHFADKAPDAYTLQFYVDMQARALNLLRVLWNSEAERPTAYECAVRMATVVSEQLNGEPPQGVDLGRLLADGKLLPLALKMFPKGPDVSELGLTAGQSEFARLFFENTSCIEFHREAVFQDLQPWD
jgi:tetratricopeptide (TPR) repeat protein